MGDRSYYRNRKIGIEDMRCGSTSAKVPTTGGPTWSQIGTSGIYTHKFAKGDVIWLEMQMSHGYLDGTAYTFHVHWAPDDAGAGNVNWKLTYQAVAIAAAFSGAASSDTGTDLLDATTSTAYGHHLTPESTLSGAGLTASFVLIGKLERVDNATDTYTGGAFFFSADCHYRKAWRGTDIGR
ncbi:MAG TPA: hypothetical protein VMW48_08960 [Vicinamibacterales bacterium]|nr:hypothetical protein [Vicinamibacterales bacterium]